jgi:predicted AAA+ superfamily ATPase
MIKRLLLNLIRESFEATPICALLAPRQCGKTTLAKVYTNIRKDICLYTSVIFTINCLPQ